jgi:single-stranded-DNA-specific exonuclease
LTEDDFEEKITIDVPMPFSYVTQQFVEELSVLEPFGNANEKPVFAQKNIRFIRGYIMGKNNNMARFDVMDENDRRYTMVCFRNLDKLTEYLEKKEGREKTERLFSSGLYPQDAVLMDVIYYPNINEFRGKTSVQYILQDYK